MIDVCTIDEPQAATAILDPIRNELLTELSQPSSAAGLAARLGLPRQKINYHLRELERLGLATVAKERKWGGITERLTCPYRTALTGVSRKRRKGAQKT